MSKIIEDLQVFAYTVLSKTSAF